MIVVGVSTTSPREVAVRREGALHETNGVVGREPSEPRESAVSDSADTAKGETQRTSSRRYPALVVAEILWALGKP